MVRLHLCGFSITSVCPFLPRQVVTILCERITSGIVFALVFILVLVLVL